MSKIPTHKIPEKFQGEIFIMRYMSGDEEIPAVNYAHKDDYYIFLFVEKGAGKMLIDFKEYEIRENSIHCILPGQIHLPLGEITACGWVLAIDSMFVKDDYKEIFEKTSFLNSDIKLDAEVINELKNCATVIYKRTRAERQHIEESILHALLSYYIGMFAEIYQKGYPVLANNRAAWITLQFKSLLSAHYQILKRPSQYASQLNISPVYLNEAVKKTTGMSVSNWIQNEIIIQAKRLLHYTDMPIKEIALELGYEDWAYFTRLFTKISSLSPTQFRKKYLK
ncbi:MAG: AraC family transcriptional regulator [Odoribacter sp.]|nr:AraC family transcriptional regulator [Odoribacter sp.]